MGNNAVLRACAFACFLLGFTGCQKSTADPHTETLPTADEFAAGSASTTDLSQFHVALHVRIGAGPSEPLIFKLWSEVAPLTCRNFLRLCRSGFYDGLTFHRVVDTFMIQGGCANGDGSGVSPFGMIPGEFHTDEQWRHRYGVLSMARLGHPDSAGSQFFVICRDGPTAWALDGQYASFGELVSGVPTLETIAQVEVGPDAHDKMTAPQIPIVIERAEVRAGPAPEGPPLTAPERPQFRWGPPNTCTVQTLLIRTKGRRLPSERTFDEGKKETEALFERAQNGESFQQLVRDHSEDPIQKGMDQPVGYHFAREGSQPSQGLRKVFLAQQESRKALLEIQSKKQSGEWSSLEATKRRDAISQELMRKIRSVHAIPQAERPRLATESFAMEVGEVRILPPDPGQQLEGFYLIKRIE